MKSGVKKYIKWATSTPVWKNSKTLLQAQRELKAFFEGKKRRFSTPIDLSSGTHFQQKVWKALQKIPYGSTRSYAWIAQKIGHPKAVRAVGSACKKNPIPIIVPCHRVIRSNGELGRYASGSRLKYFLLKLERTACGKR